MERKQVSTGTPWEAIAAYSRAVRVGPFVYISGTTATDQNGQILRPDDAYGQTVETLKKIEASLHAVEARLEHVVRIRVYVVNMDHWQQVAKALHEFFQDIRPTNTLVEVSRLATPEMLVEIDADALIPESLEQPVS